MITRPAQRRRKQVLHRAALAFACDGECRDDDHRHRQDTPNESGHDVILRDVFGIVMLCKTRLNGAELARISPVARSIHDSTIRRQRNSSRRRRSLCLGSVASASRQQIRLSPAQQFAREIPPDFHDELHCALAPAVFLEFRLALRFARDVEVTAVAHRSDKVCAKKCRCRRNKRRSACFGSNDGVTAQNKLHQRNAKLMANVSRSRRIWMNSFATWRNRCQLNLTSIVLAFPSG